MSKKWKVTIIQKRKSEFAESKNWYNESLDFYCSDLFQAQAVIQTLEDAWPEDVPEMEVRIINLEEVEDTIPDTDFMEGGDSNGTM